MTTPLVPPLPATRGLAAAVCVYYAAIAADEHNARY